MTGKEILTYAAVGGLGVFIANLLCAASGMISYPAAFIVTIFVVLGAVAGIATVMWRLDVPPRRGP